MKRSIGSRKLIDKNVPHHARGPGKEMCAILPMRTGPFRQSHIGLVQQSRRLQRVVGSFTAHETLRQPVQLFVNERRDFV